DERKKELVAQLKEEGFSERDIAEILGKISQGYSLIELERLNNAIIIILRKETEIIILVAKGEKKRILSLRGMSKKEIKKKLREAGLDEKEIEKVLRLLEKEGSHHWGSHHHHHH
uniref:De novo designed protein F3 parent n=1 Tax=synthetic construct TaxID=32630 RepID=UPI0034E057C8